MFGFALDLLDMIGVTKGNAEPSRQCERNEDTVSILVHIDLLIIWVFVLNVTDEGASISVPPPEVAARKG